MARSFAAEDDTEESNVKKSFRLPIANKKFFRSLFLSLFFI